ncbi:tetratricopeptide repeat protein [Roseovarius rhodophyticola]|uniref:Tetratricopeptide repeat protein n=1 Tax=Roseovarius rhodophyticola TaxID=3080827 RepID=A0ABZ2TFQ6_9RHOB|nr:tetratricopeptide repeat protein [Roseovarius sp. W115]MDV2928809.1 tetratricopeptide repeat protein [Roseovarius sp. W115]
MSNTDSFIEEVAEEVRRDKLFKLLKRYGWIAVAAVLLLVGATAWNEWNKSQQRQAAQALGDQVLNALESDDRAERAAALAAIETPEGGARGILGLLAASEAGTDAPEEAAAQLLALADDPNVPQVYRQIAVLKAIALPDNGLSAEDRRSRLDGLLPGGGLVRLLADEQLAYLDIEAGNNDAALDRLRQIGESAEATIGLRQRAAQMVVALGGELTQAPALPESGQDDGN